MFCCARGVGRDVTLNDNGHFQEWLTKAGYNYNPFGVWYAEWDAHLEANFVPHAGHFEEYAAPCSTIIVGSRGSGKTANCIKLAETLQNAHDATNFVLAYDARTAWETVEGSGSPTCKHHLREIIRHSSQALVNAKVGSLARQDERKLYDMHKWCQEYHPYADYWKKLEALHLIASAAGYDAFYLLIDERQSIEREIAMTIESLTPLLDGSLFGYEQLYVKLFVPDELSRAAEELRRDMDEHVEVVYLQWSESDLSELLRALLSEAHGGANTFFSRAGELGRLAPFFNIQDAEQRTIKIDQAFIQAVDTTAPTPRAMMLLGHILFNECARRWEPDQNISITSRVWAAALQKWHHSLRAGKSALRPITLLPFRILFTNCNAKEAEATLFDPPGGHPILLPYERRELWPILWALEQYVKGTPMDEHSPHLKHLRRLGLIEEVNSKPVLVHDLLERIGERLYHYLFRKSGLEHWLARKESEAERIQDEGIEDVRVWIELGFDEEASALANYPWELLRRDEVFLLQTGKFELTRYHSVKKPEPQLRLNRPLELLYIAPRVKSSGLRFDSHSIRQAFRSSNMLRMREVTPPSFERLMQETDSSGCQVFHYDDHGTFGRYCSSCGQLFAPWCKKCPEGHPLPGPQGYLQFGDSLVGEDPRPATDVLHALYERGLQLAFVNACKSSAQAEEPAFGGMAPALIRAGIPVVVGMLTSIEDEAATLFVQAFYEALGAALRGQNLSGQAATKALLRAMCAGRRRMLSEARFPPGKRCWWVPGLSLRYR